MKNQTTKKQLWLNKFRVERMGSHIGIKEQRNIKGGVDENQEQLTISPVYC